MQIGKNLRQAENKQLGRAFNHLEDLVFFYGSKGTAEALQHLRDFATVQGSSSIRMKWDGNPQIYWGRQTAGGPLVLAGHNQWSRRVIATTPEQVKDFIANKSGNPKDHKEWCQREQFAEQFASLYDHFDKATPENFQGYVYADGLFLSPQTAQDGVYTFSPNPRSKTCYHVNQHTELGRRISNAKTMVVGHAFFAEFGAADSKQKPIDDFSMFNRNSDLIVQGPVYNTQPVKINTDEIVFVENYMKQHAHQIDSFLEGTVGLSDLKNIIYTYVNHSAKSKQLDSISEKHFFHWLTNSKVSKNKQKKIADLNQQFLGAVNAMFELVKMIQNIKDSVIDQIKGKHGDIWDTNGEGHVRYSDPDKQFGNIKLVPRKEWTPA